MSPEFLHAEDIDFAEGVEKIYNFLGQIWGKSKQILASESKLSVMDILRK